MKAVVPAAGEGTRLRPLTTDRPKALVDVAGKPLLARVLDAVVPLDVDEVVVVVGYRAADVVSRFGDVYDGVPVRYVRQPETDGLADAVLAAERAVGGDFLVVNGDNAIDADLGPVVDHHREHSPEATVPVTRVEPEAARETGVAVVDDGRVRSVVEKPDDPPSRWAMAGLQVFSPRIFDACRLVTPSSRGELELSAAIDLLARAGHRVDAVDLPGWRLNVNTPEDVEAATRRLE